jgi:hypothetical protein
MIIGLAVAVLALGSAHWLMRDQHRTDTKDSREERRRGSTLPGRRPKSNLRLCELSPIARSGDGDVFPRLELVEDIKQRHDIAKLGPQSRLRPLPYPSMRSAMPNVVWELAAIRSEFRHDLFVASEPNPHRRCPGVADHTAAASAATPEDEPPGVSPIRQGFCVAPVNGFSPTAVQPCSVIVFRRLCRLLLEA